MLKGQRVAFWNLLIKVSRELYIPAKRKRKVFENTVEFYLILILANLYHSGQKEDMLDNESILQMTPVYKTAGKTVATLNYCTTWLLRSLWKPHAVLPQAKVIYH